MFVKPEGGFWASPVDAKRGWADWCLCNDFQLNRLKESFTFTLTDDAKILHIYSVKQLEALPKAKQPVGMEGFTSWVLLDFEVLEKEYDGIELHLSEEIYDSSDDWFGSGLYYKLYGWDCDSILIFHDNIIKIAC